ncbi:GNAT family N-acetyltransferase [Roseobacteraceae bacterium S113]
MTQILATTRLQMRPPVMADAPAVAAMCNSREVTRWLTQLPYPYTIADAQEFIARQTSGKTFLIHDATGPVGCIGTVGEFGYWLGHDHWGQGYATEASRAVLDWHFETDGTDLRSGHAVENHRSRNVLLKLGFQDVEIVERAHTITGKTRLQQVMELRAQAWKART